MDEESLGNHLKVLLVSAHADDAEISCGGTIAKLKREKAEVRSIYFCPCTEDPKNIGHLEEHREACEFLRIDHLYEEQFARDVLEYHKQEVRDILYKIRVEYKPDLVLCPSPSDFHQDHRAVADCAITIFRDTSTILGFEVLRSVSPSFKADYFIILDECEVHTKLLMLHLYKSQMLCRSYFFTEERFKAQMVMRGTQARSKWAEAYELIWGREK